MVKIYVPRRGDIVWLDFDPQAGREIQKTRPALVISPKSYNEKTRFAIFMPITSKIKGYPFEVLISLDCSEAAILCDQVRSLDYVARNAQYITKISNLEMQEVLGKFRVLID